ncbi:MAG: hypothetical protein JEZ09_17815 [Salinivirgaceae bacterium]|nr:hypothetical protein [Salinivirgaceae bacterium]
MKYQGSSCSRCPIFNCGGDCPMIDINSYQEDWAVEWVEYFKTGKIPELRF